MHVLIELGEVLMPVLSLLFKAILCTALMGVAVLVMTIGFRDGGKDK